MEDAGDFNNRSGLKRYKLRWSTFHAGTAIPAYNLIINDCFSYSQEH